MKAFIELSSNEIQSEIPYVLICEVMGSASWNTGKRRRLWKDCFTESERQACAKLYKQSQKWYFVKGVPDTIKVSINTLRLWYKLGEFCTQLNAA